MSIALISSILTAKFGTSISLVNEDLIPHPADLVGLAKFLKDFPNKTKSDYVYIYEAFEIRSVNKVYSHILKGTVDLLNPSFLQFETDMDLNTSTMVLGAAAGKHVVYNGISGRMYRRVFLDYKSIDTVEYVRIKAE